MFLMKRRSRTSVWCLEVSTNVIPRKNIIVEVRRQRVSCLCACLEAVFQHGLKHNNKALSTLKQVTQLTGLTRIGSGISLLDDIKNMETEPTFWHYAKEHLGKHDAQRFLLLRHISTDAGRSRAWLRASINEQSLEKYSHMWLENAALISQYYEDWAFMRDADRSSVLPNMAAGLNSILFAISIDNTELNSIKPASGLDNFRTLSSSVPASTRVYSPQTEEELRPVIASDGSPKVDKKKDRRRKKKAAHIISFDEGSMSSYSTSPASSVASPRNATTFDLTHKPEVTAGVSRLQEFRNNGATQSFDASDKSVVNNAGIKGHIRTGSCDNPLLYYTGDTGSLKSAVKGNGGSQKSVHFGDIPESGNKKSEDGVSNVCVHSSSVVSNDSGLEEEGTDNAIKKEFDTSSPLKNSPMSSPVKTVYSSGEQQNMNGSFDKLAQSANVCSPVTSKVCSPVMKIKSAPALASLGRSGSDVSNVSINSDQSLADDSLSLMTPVLEGEDAPSGAITIRCSNRGAHDDSTSDSYDSGELLMYNEMTKHAAKALAMAQPAEVVTRAEVNSSDGFRTQGDGSHTPEPSTSTVQDAMTTTDLKQAVIAMMGRKDEVEAQNKALMCALEHELATSSTLRLEIEEMRREQRARGDRDADRINTLTRENELLKHQLKKYVNAVQLLRRQGAKPEDFPGIHLDEVQQPLPPYKAQIDYSHEAEEYERKLVQVAEMHGELMEFNEVLQKQLLNQETIITNLREELVDLRGPLPDDGQTGDDNISLVTDDSTESRRPLINVWIPSAFLKGSKTDSHHVYQVYVRIRDEEWNTYHRYSQFLDLHTSLKKRFPIISTYRFPPKKAIGSKEPKLVENRRKGLEAYIRKVVNLLVLGNPDLATTASKETLIKTLPFFGDQLGTDKKKKGRKDKSRISQRSSEGQSSQGQQYMGL